MANVLGREKREQILALGRLGWTLRRIEAETGVRRETASAYLKAAGIAIRPPRRWGKAPPKPASMRRPAVSSTRFALRPPTALAVAGESGREFGSTTRLPFALVEGRVSWPVHDEVRGVRVLPSKSRPRGSAGFPQSPGHGGVGSSSSDSLACASFREGLISGSVLRVDSRYAARSPAVP